jgi:hypothetical protein
VIARRLAAWCAAALAAAAVAWVAVDAARDRADLDAAERSVAGARDALARREPGAAIDGLREAGSRLAAFESRPAWRHAWSTVADAGRAGALRAELDGAVQQAAAALEARSASIAETRRLFERIERSTTLGDLDAVDASLASVAAAPGSDPEAVAQVRDASARARSAYERDEARNREAIAALNAALDRATTPAELRAVMDAVLPARARGQDAGILRAITGRASIAHDRLLAERLDAAEREADGLLDGSRAQALAARVDRDPDLSRPGAAALGDRVRAVRSALRARAAALGAWEARLAAAVGAIERGDWAAAHEAAVALRAGAPEWDRSAPGVESLVGPAAARVDAQVDRGRYDTLLRTPNRRSARDYLEGWPEHPRRMAEAVRSWLTAAETAPLAFDLVAVRWSSTGAPAPGRLLEDRPDALLELRVEDAPWQRASFVDVVEGVSTPAPAGVRSEWRAPDDALVRVGVRITIDLRDAIAADPVAIGAVAAPAGMLAGRRTVVIDAADPAWSGRPHEVTLRVGYAGVPDLPPFASVPSVP